MLPHSTQLALSLETEQWRPIVGYEGWYEISSLGRVRRLRPSNNTYVGRILRQSPNGTGYLTLGLSRDGQGSGYRLVHRLVAEAWVGPQPPGHQVNHKDGNKTNNRPENLEWVTSARNHRHASESGLTNPPHGENHHRAKLTEDTVREIRESRTGVSCAELARQLNVDPSTVWNARYGRSWCRVR